MNPAVAILACNSMHLPWWVGPAAIYLLVGWGISAILALINLFRFVDRGDALAFKVMNGIKWAFYAFPILYAAAVLCHVAALPPTSLPDPLGNFLWVYSFLVPPAAIWHTAHLFRS